MLIAAGGGGESWPGLTANPKEITFNPTKMNEVADALQADLNRYQGILQQLTDPVSGTDLSTQDLGNWDVASDLALAAHKGHQATTQYLQEMLTQYQNVIGAIRKSAENYAKHEDDNTAKVSAVGVNGSPVPPASSTPASTPTASASPSSFD